MCSPFFVTLNGTPHSTATTPMATKNRRNARNQSPKKIMNVIPAMLMSVRPRILRAPEIKSDN